MDALTERLLARISGPAPAVAEELRPNRAPNAEGQAGGRLAPAVPPALLQPEADPEAPAPGLAMEAPEAPPAPTPTADLATALYGDPERPKRSKAATMAGLVDRMAAPFLAIPLPAGGILYPAGDFATNGDIVGRFNELAELIPIGGHARAEREFYALHATGDRAAMRAYLGELEQAIATAAGMAGG